VTLSPRNTTDELHWFNVDIPQVPQRGRISVQKHATEPEFAVFDLSGAVFEIRNVATGALVQTITTNASGLAQSRELPFARYRISERTAPFGYLLNSNSFELVLSPHNTTDLVHWVNLPVPQVPQRGRISIQKHTTDPNFTVHDLGGAVFNIRNADTGALVQTVTTNANGQAQTIPRTGDDRRLQWLSLILSIIIIVGCGVTLYTLNKADKLHKESDGDDEKDT